MKTLGLCVIDLLNFSADALAQKFRTTPTPHNLTQWCNMREILTDRTGN